MKLVLILQNVFVVPNMEIFSVQEFKLCLSKLEPRKLAQKQFDQQDQVVPIQYWLILLTVFLPQAPLPS